MGSIFKDANKALEAANKRKLQQKMEEDRNTLLMGLGKDFANILRPILDDTMKQLIQKYSIVVNPPKVEVPEARVRVDIPEIKVPQPKVNVTTPPVVLPEIKIPKMSWPDGEMPIKGWVQLMGIDRRNPLPVELRDADGKPLSLIENLTQVISSGGGGARIVKINNTTDNPVPVTGSFSASITADYGEGEIGTNTLRIVQATDAVASVNIVSGSASGTEYDELATADPGVGPLVMAKDSNSSVYALRLGSGTSETALRVLQASDSVSSVYVTGSNGSLAVFQLDADGNYRDEFTVVVNGSVDSTGAYLLDGDGNYRGTIPVEGTVAVSGVSGTVAANIVDSTGVAYSGSNPVPVDGSGVTQPVSGTVAVSGITNSVAVYNLDGDGNYKDATPVEATNLDIRDLTDASDSIVATPIAVRGGRYSAYASITTGVETTLKSAEAGLYLDLIQITAANQSDAAVTIDVRAVSGGNIITSLTIPAESTAGIATSAPLPQDNQGNAWTIQNNGSDVSNTTVDVTALFVGE